MNFSAISAIVCRQWYLLRGNATRVVNSFIWVAVDMVVWGFMTLYLNQITAATFNFVPVLLGAVLLWNFLTRVMHSISMCFMEDIWSRNFLNLFATPLTVTDYLVGLVVGSIGSIAIGLLVMIGLAATIFGLSFASYGIMALPFFIILFLFGTALGILGCAIMLRLGPASEWFVWPIPAFMIPFAGVQYPISTLPEWMQIIAHGLPPMYVFESLRAIVQQRTFDVGNLLIGFGLSVAYVALASYIFVRVHRYALRVGLLARYTAESVT